MALTKLQNPTPVHLSSLIFCLYVLPFYCPPQVPLILATILMLPEHILPFPSSVPFSFPLPRMPSHMYPGLSLIIKYPSECNLNATSPWRAIWVYVDFPCAPSSIICTPHCHIVS